MKASDRLRGCMRPGTSNGWECLGLRMLLVSCNYSFLVVVVVVVIACYMVIWLCTLAGRCDNNRLDKAIITSRTNLPRPRPRFPLPFLPHLIYHHPRSPMTMTICIIFLTKAHHCLQQAEIRDGSSREEARSLWLRCMPCRCFIASSSCEFRPCLCGEPACMY